jgi:hypothetical protein
VQAESASRLDWRDAAAYAPLLGADRSLFAWEWLRRDPRYIEAAAGAVSTNGRRSASAAAGFGLVEFEPPHLTVPDARPLWISRVHPYVLPVMRGRASGPRDRFDLERFRTIAKVAASEEGGHLLLSDGLHTLRLDGPPGTFRGPPVCLRYLLEGLQAAESPLLTLRRFLVLCRRGRFSRALHPHEPRARRWILMLRAYDALAAGARQREIAEALLGRSTGEPLWRSREPSLRSQVQRLVRSARTLAGGDYRMLLR